MPTAAPVPIAAMPRRVALAAVVFLAAAAAPGHAQTIRIATFNLALYGTKAGEILARLNRGDDAQARHLAEIIQRVKPDVLVLNEIDYDAHGEVLDAFCNKYLAVGQNVSQSPAGPAEPIAFSYRMAFPTNTGEHSRMDIDGNSRVDATPGARDYAGDCWGYGVYPGQYGFALLSRFPIDKAGVRQFRNFLWKDMPDARLPDLASMPGPGDWYAPEVIAQFRLSSKNHCDVPITVDGKRIHLLLSHPTPPVFDGPEDRNGRRNHDELRFWVDYIAGPPPSKGREQPSTVASGDRAQGDSPHSPRGGIPDASTPEANSAPANAPAPVPSGSLPSAGRAGGEAGTNSYFIDDAGVPGGLAASTLRPQASGLKPSFIILGDLNGDPADGDGPEGITQLLAAPQILKYPAPTSLGASEAARLQGGVNARHRGDPAEDTEDAADAEGPGNLRLDYILPSADLAIAASGVFWPEAADPLAPLVAGAAHPASSDHRLVWIDLKY